MTKAEQTIGFEGAGYRDRVEWLGLTLAVLKKHYYDAPLYGFFFFHGGKKIKFQPSIARRTFGIVTVTCHIRDMRDLDSDGPDLRDKKAVVSASYVTFQPVLAKCVTSQSHVFLLLFLAASQRNKGEAVQRIRCRHTRPWRYNSCMS